MARGDDPQSGMQPRLGGVNPGDVREDSYVAGLAARLKSRGGRLVDRVNRIGHPWIAAGLDTASASANDSPLATMARSAAITSAALVMRDR
jgi:hypothetical protein